MADENEFGNSGSRSGEKASDVTSNLKSVGIDTDRMTEAAGDRAGELQRMLIEEVRAQPLRALAWAAAAGVVIGFWAAK
ncbi:hypothetical protein [Bosea sp. BH3]|uniref:hypothetical protein n=1 Tax=Bosea sp. BH3 TaxID=2871701 RepID=UPI0021CB6BFA|nr:hypothetical protein [Bosea sp. BH3]MCU4180145.1 hypothetical protein [Bosea sp. BH3]